MTFHPPATDAASGALVVCRYIRWNILVLLAVLWAIPTGVAGGGGPGWIVWLTAALPALLTPPMVGSWLRRGRRANWVLALHRDGLWLNLRDCEFCEAEPGDTALFIPYREIASAAKSVSRYTLPSTEPRSVTHRDVALVLTLNVPATQSVRAALAADKARPLTVKKYFGGLITVQSSRGGAPVEALDGDRLRIMFSDATRGVSPRLGRVLRVLADFIAVGAEPAPQTSQPTADWRHMDDAAFDALVLQLADRGRRIDCVKLLKERRGMTTTEACKFYDELTGCLAPTR